MQKEDKSNEIRSCADLNTVEDNLKDRITILYQVLHLSPHYVLHSYANPMNRAMMRTGQQLRSFKWVTR